MSDELNWLDFLGRWQDEWVPRPDEEVNAAQSSMPLGGPGADEAAIAAAEERPGRRLPPSYRTFLAVSDGWHVEQTTGIYQLGGTADIDWFGDPYDMARCTRKASTSTRSGRRSCWPGCGDGRCG
ncbi:hypothetical protein GCM10010335_68100 [Streptomyces galbus]|nr:hypothetical protein GCM10010335_68100 [Streptomyces galbus]